MNQRLLEQFRNVSQAAHDSDFSKAVSMCEQAFAEAPEQTGDDRALKAALAFHCGYCLLKSHGISDTPLQCLTSQQIEVASRARAFWLENMRLYGSLDPSSEAFFNGDLASGARAVVLESPLMRGEHLVYQAHSLAPGGDQTSDKEGAVELFDEALALLDQRIPEHQNLIRMAHRRLAVLCNDTGRPEEAVRHAEWVLTNEKDLDSTSRMMMQVLAGKASGEILSSSSKCFIATAAFGSPTAVEVSVLREFRDRRMMSGPTGQICIALYERLSPPISRFLETHEIMRKALRLALVPVVTVARLSLQARLRGGHKK